VSSRGPDHVAVIGAGIVGLSTAWFLQARGIAVTVIDQGDVGAGSSWGNAGWITPALVSPLPEPAVLRYGLKATLSPRQPVYVPALPSLGLLAFLRSFVSNCTTTRWQAAMSALAPIAHQALDAYADLTAGGVRAPVNDADPMLACYQQQRERAPLLDELRAAQGLGADVEFDAISGEEARQIEPMLSGEVTAAVRIGGQRYIDPYGFLSALADHTRANGVQIRTGSRVVDIDSDGQRAVVSTGGGDIACDAVVLATGAWISQFGTSLGIRPRLQAGRGYSFVVASPRPVQGPLYFPAARLACTPLPHDDVRIVGVMEFKDPDAPLNRRRILATAAAAERLLNLEVEPRTHEWVGARPCTADGLPVIGRTKVANVYVAGGHGMWGVTLGPVTGRLMAELVATGTTPPQIAAFDPRRGSRPT
jgi:D-amino-acid dehydrogenase